MDGRPISNAMLKLETIAVMVRDEKKAA